MANKSIDGRAFTSSTRQAYIFNLAKRVITREINITDIKSSVRQSVSYIVQQYHNKKITLQQINRKCYYNINNGHINSNGYTFMHNANNIDGRYHYYFYVDPLQHDPADVARTIINNGFAINNYPGCGCNNFADHRSYLVLKVSTNSRPIIRGHCYYHHSTMIAPTEIATVMIPDNLVK